MKEETLQQLYFVCSHCKQKILLPVAVSAGKPTPWPAGDPVQNFCCHKCGEARRYSETEVHFRDVTLTPVERQSLYSLKVVRQSTECGHRGFLDKDCEGLVEILHVAGLEQVRPGYLFPIIHFEDLDCTGYDKHKNSTDQTTAGTNYVLGLWGSPVVDEKWEKIQSLCKPQEW